MDGLLSIIAVIGVCVSVFVIFVCLRYAGYKFFKSRMRPRISHESRPHIEVNSWEVHYEKRGDAVIEYYECPVCHNMPLHSRYGDYDELSSFCPFCGEPLGFDDEGDE